MRKSIYMRNFLLSAGMVILSMLILGLAFMSVSYSFFVSDKREALRSSAGVVADSVSARLAADSDALSSWDLRLTLSTIAKASGVDILVADASGAVVSCSDTDIICPHLSTTLPDCLLNAAGTKVSGLVGNADGYFESSRQIFSRSVIDASSGKTAAYVVLSLDPLSMIQIWRSFAVIFFFAACFVIILSLVASVLTTGRQVAPLKEMAEASKNFARGDFTVRVKDYGRDDEISELAAAFNSMADSLEKSERLRSEFISNISHELKTPMTTITGFADGILDGTIPPDRQDKYLAIISSETRRLSRLVRRMLELSRLQSAEPSLSPFDVAETVRHTILGLESKISDKKLTITPLLPENGITVNADEDAITQVVYNLLDNAVKFSPEGSEVSISVWKQGKKAYVSVKNHGSTISPEELPLIFDRFHKADKSRGLDRDGVGLGLYIVKTIIDNHGENIYVKSQDGETEFLFTLALAQ